SNSNEEGTHFSFGLRPYSAPLSPSPRINMPGIRIWFQRPVGPSLMCPRAQTRQRRGFMGFAKHRLRADRRIREPDVQLHTQNPEIPGSPALLAPGDLLPSRLEFVTVMQLYSRICV